MKTIKLPISISEEDKVIIKKLQIEYSSLVRFSYNRLKEGKTLRDLEHDLYLEKYELLDSWTKRCAILKAKSLHESRPDQNIIFGGKHNFIQRCKNKISSDQWKDLRLLPINIQGEKHQNGNRKFNLDISNNKIIFKPKNKIKIDLVFPFLRRNYKQELIKLEKLSQEKKLPYLIELSRDYIWITYDEKLLQEEGNKFISKKGRVLGIDMNPNFLGYNISDFTVENSKILKKKCYDLTKLNKNLHFASNSKQSLYQNNKRRHEIINLAHSLVKESIHFQCEKIIIEDLNMKAKNHNKGKSFNRLVNNNWNRNLFVKKLKMLCHKFNIKLVEVNPAYSSLIGNTIYSEFDPISSSLEISRRGQFKFQEGKFYPQLSLVKHQWKEMVTKCQTWKEFSDQIKTLDIRYRVPLDLGRVGCRMRNRRACIDLYTFI